MEADEETTQIGDDETSQQGEGSPSMKIWAMLQDVSEEEWLEFFKEMQDFQEWSPGQCLDFIQTIYLSEVY